MAAESIYPALQTTQAQLTDYATAIKQSWIWAELSAARNIRPAFKYGLCFGLAYAALDTYILRGKAPWTMHNHADYAQLKPAANYEKINYIKYDGKITFDKMTALRKANVNHNHDQPAHLLLANPQIPIKVNLAKYQAPEQRYCPAGVYEIIQIDNHDPYLQINAQNCIHCKACDVKDPMQNITWVPPEGGGGPNYTKV